MNHTIPIAVPDACAAANAKQPRRLAPPGRRIHAR